MELLENIPMRYGIMKISENINNNEIVDRFVVAPCYIIKEITEYTKDSIKQSYEVVFTWDKNHSSITPSFDENKKCTNAIFVNDVYEDIEEALVIADKENKDSLRERIMSAKVEQLDAIKKAVPLLTQKYNELAKSHLNDERKYVENSMKNNTNFKIKKLLK